MATSFPLAEQSKGRMELWLLAGFVLLIWFPALHRFSIEWSVNPQYYYGWAVPLLSAYLLFERYTTAPPALAARRQWPAVLIMILAALPQLPLRLAGEPNTDWRMVSWAMAGSAIVITFAAIQLYGGWRWVWHFAFPILFLVTAIPWPSSAERLFVQGMMQINAKVAAEFVSFCGVPALAMGNVIQLPNGVLGVNEACSGIRSLQSTLMASLFLGELYRLSAIGRIFLVAAGVAIAFTFNVVRTTFLSWQGAFNGVESTERWHDTAGFAILGAVLVCLWLISMFLESRARKREKVLPPPTVPSA